MVHTEISPTEEADRLTTPFDEHSTAEEVLADVDLSGRRAIVTGASSGGSSESVSEDSVQTLAHPRERARWASLFLARSRSRELRGGGSCCSLGAGMSLRRPRGSDELRQETPEG
jgi:hypothetical protein